MKFGPRPQGGDDGLGREYGAIVFKFNDAYHVVRIGTNKQTTTIAQQRIKLTPTRIFIYIYI